MYPERVVERVLTHWHPEGDCWISDYHKSPGGYAYVGWQAGPKVRTAGAHRVAWWGFNREVIPVGMHVDHICRRTGCVRPTHLRLLTARENTSDPGRDRGLTSVPTGRKCRRGHELVKGKWRKAYCRKCNADRARDLRQRRRDGHVADPSKQGQPAAG